MMSIINRAENSFKSQKKIKMRSEKFCSPKISILSWVNSALSELISGISSRVTLVEVSFSFNNAFRLHNSSIFST